MYIYDESTIYLNKEEGINNIKEFFTFLFFFFVACFVQKMSTFITEMLCSLPWSEWEVSACKLLSTQITLNKQKSQRVKIYKIYFLDLGGGFLKFIYFLIQVSFTSLIC